MRSLLLLAAAVLVAGGAFLLLPSGAPAPTEPTAAASGADPAESGDAPAARPDELAEVASDADDRAEAPVARSLEAAPDAPLPAASTTRAERLPGALVGRVTDQDGEPLAGAEVQLAGGGRLLLLVPDAGESSGSTTDDDGRFRIEARAGRHELSVGTDRYAPFEQAIDLIAGRDTDVGEIQLAPGVRILGRVLDDRGRPVEGARVTRPVKRSGGLIRIGTSGALAAETDADGRFQILRQAIGPFEFGVDHPAYPSGRFEGVTERAAELVSGIEVTLSVGARITGRATGGLEEGLRVAARRARASAGGVPMEFDGPFVGIGGSTRRGEVEADGSFTVQGLDEGAEYELWLERPRKRFDGTARRSERVRATAGDAGVTLAYSQGATLRVTVRGPGGEPVPGAEISGGFEWLAPLGDLEIDEATGAYIARHLWPSPTGAPYRLRVEAAGYESFENERIRLIAGEVTDLGVVTLAARPQLFVTVTDASNGRPVEGAEVSVTKVRAAGTPGRISFSASFSATDEDEVDLDDLPFGRVSTGGVTDDEGRCSVDVTPGERVWVDVTHPGFAEERHGPVTLDADRSEFEASVGLGPGGSVRVSVLDHTGATLPGAKVEVRGDDGRPARDPVTTDENGEALFEGLEAGSYGFRIGESGPPMGMFLIAEGLGAGDAGGWTDVTVLPGEEVPLTLQAEEPCALTGRITEAGIPLAGATVRLRAADDPFGGLGFGLGGGISATTDARGRYRLDDVDPGESTLVVEHATRAMDHEESVEIERGDNDRDVDLSITTIAGRVVGPDGEPVVGARVEAKRQSEGPGGRAMVSFVVASSDDEDGAAFIGGAPGGPDPVRTDEDGRYLLRGVQPGATLVVEAAAKGLDKTRSEELVLAAGDRREDVDLAFVQTGSLVIVVEGADGPLIAIMTRPGESAREPRIERLEGASTTVDGLEAGAWEVRVNAIGVGGGGAQRITPEREQVDVTSGETATVTFTAAE